MESFGEAAPGERLGNQEVGGESPPLAANGPVAQRQSVQSNDLEGRRVENSRGRPDRLYAVTHAGLTRGMQAAQVGHALISWVLEHGTPPDNLVVLVAPNEEALHAALRRCTDRVVAFHEPDEDDALTAFAAGPDSWRPLSSLPLLR